MNDHVIKTDKKPSFTQMKQNLENFFRQYMGNMSCIGANNNIGEQMANLQNITGLSDPGLNNQTTPNLDETGHEKQLS